jgi:hypothetical protein
MNIDIPLQAQHGNPAAISRRAKVAMTLLVAFLCLPELALLGFFTTGALLSAPAGRRAMWMRWWCWAATGAWRPLRACGRDLVLAGYSKRLILVYPSAGEISDAQATVPGLEIVDSTPATGSWGEAMAVRELMKAEGLRSVMVVSDPPHMLRLRYTWGSVLRGTGLDYTLVATNPPWWPGWRWWRNPGASDFVGNEVLKLGYYVVRYRFGW